MKIDSLASNIRKNTIKYAHFQHFYLTIVLGVLARAISHEKEIKGI